MANNEFWGHSLTTEDGYNESIESNSKREQLYRLSGEFEEAGSGYGKQCESLNQYGDTIIKENSNQHINVDYSLETKDKYYWDENNTNNTEAGVEPSSSKESRGYPVCFTTEDDDNTMDSNCRGQSYTSVSHEEASNNEHLKSRDPLEQPESVNITEQNCFEQHVKCEDDPLDIKDQYDIPQSSKSDSVAVIEPVTFSSNEGKQQEASKRHSVCFAIRDGDKDFVESSSGEGKSCNILFGENVEPNNDHLESKEIVDWHEDNNIEPNCCKQNLEEVSYSLKSKDKKDCALDNTAHDEAVVDPSPSSSKENVQQEPSEINTCWLPSPIIKSELEDVDMKESEGDENSEDEVGQEEKLEEGSDGEMDDDDTDEGAYHLAEVSYGEEDDEDSQKPGSTEPNAILGISHDNFKPSETSKNKRVKNKRVDNHILIKTVILKKVEYVVTARGRRKQVKHYKCPTCSYSSKDKRKVTDHTYKHSGAKPYNCPDCDVRFRYSSYLREHRRIVHISTPFDCLLCGRKCGKESALVKHLRVHTGEKPFACDFCSYRSTQQNHIKVHIRIHTGEKPYECKECGYKCAYSVLLKKHMLSHTNEKNYSCMFCDYRSKTNESLQIHIKKHTGEKPFCCEHCSKCFRSKDAIKRHIKNMHGPGEFECHICKRKYNLRASLKKHINHHTKLLKNTDKIIDP